MPDTVRRTAQLVLKYWRQELQEEELNELLDWANQSEANKETFARLTNPDFLVSSLRDLSLVKQEMRDRIWTELSLTGEADPGDLTETDNRNFEKRQTNYRKWIIAAALLLIISLMTFWWTGKNRTGMADATPEGKEEKRTTGNARLLQLADGSLINTDTIENGLAVNAGSLILVKDSGILRISSLGKAADSGSFAIFSTPAEGIGRLSLPDSTEVWLNAASSLKFPHTFKKSERVVEVTGEAWFHVRHHQGDRRSAPFRVHTAKMEMEVLGTSFNVNVYPRERFATATLEEGSMRVWKKVSVTAENKNAENKLLDVVLKPGLQAQVSNDNQEGADMGGIRVEAVNLAETLSWKQK
ncbi:MAG: FecR family protein [Pseudobacter sp.]|uniref:FecR family protein n=1 Tax=Pseudobacter sp. TaxID=2045420 RepID=UPI003F7D2E10